MPKIVKQTRVEAKPISNGSVLSRIAPIGFDDDDGIKILIYGQSGSGKTTTWATFPKPILAVICSGSDKPGELRSVDTPEYRKTIKQVVLESSDELRDLINYQNEEGSFGTIVLDHVTGFQDQVLKEIAGLSEIPVSKTWGMITQQQYGQVTVKAKDMLRQLLSMSCNVVIVAQERTFGEESSEDIKPVVGAALMPGLSAWLNSSVEYIVQTHKRAKMQKTVTEVKVGKTTEKVETLQRVKGVDYCLRTGPDATYITKFRIPKGSNLPDYIVDPDYDKIMALIRGDE